MAKQRKKREPDMLIPDSELRGELEPSPFPPQREESAPPKSLAMQSLETIRANTQRWHNDTAQTIASLEEWRREIDITLAFLKTNK